MMANRDGDSRPARTGQVPLRIAIATLIALSLFLASGVIALGYLYADHEPARQDRTGAHGAP
jgi:hypothetical protein